jgi:site-specific recombinase XerD
LPVFENKSIKNITQDLIEAYQLKRKSEIAEKSKKRVQDISFRTVNIEMSELSYFFNYRIKKGYIKTNPAAKIKKLSELSRIKTLSDSDIYKLIGGATNKLTFDLAS